MTSTIERTAPADVARSFDSVVEATELPRIIRLADNLFAAVFSLMKLLPARHIIDRAIADGTLRPGATVVETSSGTFALGLALVCRLRGHPLVIVGDPAIDPALRHRLEMLGVEVDIVDDFDAPGGIQGARLRRLDQRSSRIPHSFVPRQYDNPANPDAYVPVAAQLAHAVGRIDRLVGAVGSGGSTGGLSRALRAAGHDHHLVGVDTPGSVIFGPSNGPRLLRGLGSSIHPGNVDHAAYDEVHWVPAPAAFLATRTLYADRGLFVGPTSGTAHLVAEWAARRTPEEVTVVVFPDDGYRYLDTAYSPAWLRANDAMCSAPPAAPRTVGHPREVAPGADVWSRIAWQRRTLSAVLADEPSGTS